MVLLLNKHFTCLANITTVGTDDSEDSSWAEYALRKLN